MRHILLSFSIELIHLQGVEHQWQFSKERTERRSQRRKIMWRGWELTWEW